MKKPTGTQIQEAYALAKERYSALGVDTEQALATLENVAISLHCWQGDDVGGFESPGGELGGGLATTGNYLGKARTSDELRRDLDVVYSLLPGSHRLNLHAIYAETGSERVESALSDASSLHHKRSCSTPPPIGNASNSPMTTRVGMIHFTSRVSITCANRSSPRIIFETRLSLR